MKNFLKIITVLALTPSQYINYAVFWLWTQILVFNESQGTQLSLAEEIHPLLKFILKLQCNYHKDFFQLKNTKIANLRFTKFPHCTQTVTSEKLGGGKYWLLGLPCWNLQVHTITHTAGAEKNSLKARKPKANIKTLYSNQIRC